MFLKERKQKEVMECHSLNTHNNVKKVRDCYNLVHGMCAVCSEASSAVFV